ncbi:MAG: hypothetical protein Q8Q60_01445 [Candidatus Chromulinivorax sp.]|nr:hypothetical protein [Candidatus Chromulinivorax sp.]
MKVGIYGLLAIFMLSFMGLQGCEEYEARAIGVAQAQVVEDEVSRFTRIKTEREIHKLKQEHYEWEKEHSQIQSYCQKSLEKLNDLAEKSTEEKREILRSIIFSTRKSNLGLYDWNKDCQHLVEDVAKQQCRCNCSESVKEYENEEFQIYCCWPNFTPKDEDIEQDVIALRGSMQNQVKGIEATRANNKRKLAKQGIEVDVQPVSVIAQAQVIEDRS